jgi:class 3 adenylate cyclase
MQLPIHFLRTSDDVRIACCSQGEGRPLVFVRGWLSHIELAWDDPRFRAYFEPLIRHFRLVRYDMRGNGLSDRHPEALDLDAALHDLETVMDGLALDRVTLYGQFFGGPIAIAYAARYPERVASLILDNTYARGRDLATAAQRERFLRMLGDNPETAMFTVSYLTDPEPQGAVTLRDHYKSLGEWQERVSPETVARLYALGYAIDVTDLLDGVAAPTLVMHRRENRAIRLSVGRDLASRIKGARFVALPGAAANPWDGDAASALSAVGEFLGLTLKLGSSGASEDAALAAPLRTILFTDMESSTETTQRLGDAGAQHLVRTHNTIVRDALSAHSGHEIKHTGDGIMAWFTSASGAIECAIDIQRAIESLNKGSGDNIRVRIGINAGEPVVEDGDLFGTSVQFAARVCARAEGGHVLVSNVVRELCAGKGFLFAEIGDVALRGFEDPVRLYEVRWREEA